MEKQNDMEYIKFKQIYEDVYNDCKYNLKYKRNKFFIKVIVFVLLVVSIIIGFLYCNDETIMNILLFLLIATMFIGLFLIISSKEKYNDIYRKELITNFIKLTKPKLMYNNNILKNYIIKKDIQQEYKNAKFENTYFNNFHIINYIEGEIVSNYKIQMMSLNIYERISKNNRKEIFKGNYTIIDKRNEFEIKIYTKRKKKIKRNNLISIEDTEFNKIFEVESFYGDFMKNYLTSELKDFLLNFRNKYKIDFDLVLKDKTYIRFYTKDMFKIRLFGKPIDESSIYQLYAIITFAEDLVKTLDKADGLPQLIL